MRHVHSSTRACECALNARQHGGATEALRRPSLTLLAPSASLERLICIISVKADTCSLYIDCSCPHRHLPWCAHSTDHGITWGKSASAFYEPILSALLPNLFDRTSKRSLPVALPLAHAITSAGGGGQQIFCGFSQLVACTPITGGLTGPAVVCPCSKHTCPLQVAACHAHTRPPAHHMHCAWHAPEGALCLPGPLDRAGCPQSLWHKRGVSCYEAACGRHEPCCMVAATSAWRIVAAQ